MNDSSFWKRVVLDDDDVETNSKQRKNPVTCVAGKLEQSTQNSGRPGSPVNVACFGESQMSHEMKKLPDNQMEGFWFTNSGFVIGNDDVMQTYKTQYFETMA